MDFERKYNTKSPAVKRIMREACELKDATEEYWARPLEDNLFEWHFTVRGPPGSDFAGGLYHGRIILPSEYPMKPPHIILMTPNGRFETNNKICLSISGHHPETWQPSWSIRTALLALIAFMPTPGNGTIGSLDYTPEERQHLAKKSQTWECPDCGKIYAQLTNLSSKPPTQEESDLINNIALKGEENIAEKVEDSSTVCNKDIADEFKSEVRYRGSASRGETDLSGQQAPSMVSNNNRDTAKCVLMWVLIVAIALLIFRRLFLL